MQGAKSVDKNVAYGVLDKFAEDFVNQQCDSEIAQNFAAKVSQPFVTM